MKKIALALILAAAAVAQESITVRLDNTTGNSTTCSTRLGPGTFAIQSWSFGAADPVSMSGSGAGSGKATLSALAIAKQLDECSTALFAASVQGAHAAKLTLTQTDSSGRMTLMTVKLESAVITNYQISGSATNAAPVETVSFAFSKIMITYYGGSGQIQFGWDITKNAPGTIQ